jgi:hypothetical protein
MVILARIKVRPVHSDAEAERLRRAPEVQCREGDEHELLLHAALLQRLGFDTPKIRRLLANHRLISKAAIANSSTSIKPR